VGCVGRVPRLVVPDGMYHVASRGNNKQVIFDDALRRVHLRNLDYISEDHGWTVVAWALMSNHYHLLIENGPDVPPARQNSPST
jgi:REP element-mobilizing transposase RayT